MFVLLHQQRDHTHSIGEVMSSRVDNSGGAVFELAAKQNVSAQVGPTSVV